MAVPPPLVGRWAVACMAPNEPGRQSARLFGHGSLELRWYQPRGQDPQSPHDRDELYVVQSGRGRFRAGPHVTEFEPGDVLFVPAGADHRFEDFTDDLGLWVMFYGPAGGEPESA